MSAVEVLPEQNPSALTPAEQGSEIPLGWKPTLAHPVPVVRCTQIKKDGNRCNQWSLRGYHKCVKHAGPGAQMENGNVLKYAQSVIEAGRLRLVDTVDPAIDQLVSLMQPGTGEAIRLKAATEVLDRAGIRGGFEVDVSVEVTDNPADILKKRIADLREGMEARRKLTEVDIVDGEVIEDSEQLELFDMDEDES